MKVYIVADMEGISGTIDPYETFDNKKNKDYPLFRSIMTKEINAVAKTCFDCGVKKVVIDDFHGNSKNILIDKLHPEAELNRGSINPDYGFSLSGLDDTFDALIFIGAHSRMNDKCGVMNHTLTDMIISDLKVNGKSIGEFDLVAGIAGDLNIPVVLVSGDNRVIERARKIIPGIEEVSTKFGFNDISAICKTPQKVYKELEEKTKIAISNLPKYSCFKFSSDIKIELKYVKQAQADLGSIIPGVERIDQFTVRWFANSGIDLYKKVTVLVRVA